MRARRHIATLMAALMVAVVATALSAVAPGTAATSTTVQVTAMFTSSATANLNGCQTGESGITSFGGIAASSSYVAEQDCSIVFGTSGPSSMLRMHQEDLGGNAAWTYGNGALDFGFNGTGKSGKAEGDVGNRAYGSDIHADGRLVVGGYADWTVTDKDFGFARFLNDGTPDPACDTDGSQSTDVSNPANLEDFAWDVVIDRQDRILLFGERGTAGNPDLAIMRYLEANCAPDPAFGTGGLAVWDGGGVVDKALGAVELASGRLIIVGQSNWGSYLWRFNANGTIDNSWQTNGARFTGYRSLVDVIELADGRLAAVGEGWTGAEHDAVVQVFHPNGNLDTSFAGNGTYEFLAANGPDDYMQAIAQDDAGRLVVAGREHDGTDHEVHVARLNLNGTLDTGFATGGEYFWANPTAGDDSANDVVIQRDGKILVSGTVQDGGNPDATLFRFLADGTLDPGFAASGVLIDSPMGGWDASATVEIGVDGRYMVGAGAFHGMVVDTGTVQSNFNDTVTDWNDGDGAFGACLRAVSGGATTDVDTWTEDADNDCNTVDSDPWNAIPALSSDPGAKVAESLVAGTQTARADIRFGVRVPAVAASDAIYYAPVVLEVIDPNI